MTSKETSIGTRALSWVLVLSLVFGAALAPLLARADVASANVASVTAVLSDNDVNDATSVTVAFAVGAAGALTANVHDIIITFPSGTVMPTSVGKNSVIVTVGSTSAIPSVDPTVSGRTITLKAAVAAANSATVSVLISGSAGIINGPKASTSTTYAAVKVSTSVETTPVTSAAYNSNNGLDHVVTHSGLAAGKRATAVTTTVEGFAAATTATAKVTTSSVTYSLGSTTVGSDGTGTISWTASPPQLAAGSNTVTITDGIGGSKTAAYTLKPTLTLTPSSGVVGRAVTVSGTDWIAAETIAITNGITMGGANAGPTAQITASAAKTIAGTIAVPSTLNLGVVSVSATGSTSGAVTATFEVTGAPITLSPATAVPGTKITVSGSGFTASGTIAASAVTFGGSAWNSAAVSLTSSGDFLTTLTLTSALAGTAGTYEVVVADSTGRKGTSSFVVPGRTLTLSPTSSFRGTTVTATGSGYSKSSTVTIAYAGTAVATTTSTSGGDIAVTFTSPSAASYGINTVTATDGNSLAKTAKHTIPSQGITLSAASGSVGGSLTVSGTNYPLFTNSSAFTLGGSSVGTTGNTDSTGVFSKAVTVPAVSTGPQIVVVTIDGRTASANFTVTAATTTVATAISGLVDSSGASVVSSVWYRDNSGQVWSSYAEGAPADLTSLVKGRPYMFVLSAAPASAWVSPTGSQTLGGGVNLIVY
jgi:hypothetical protein